MYSRAGGASVFSCKYYTVPPAISDGDAIELQAELLGTITHYANEKMAALAWGVDQHRLYLAFPARIKTQRILGDGPKSKLHLAGAGHRRVLHRRVGARLEMALS